MERVNAARVCLKVAPCTPTYAGACGCGVSCLDIAWHLTAVEPAFVCCHSVILELNCAEIAFLASCSTFSVVFVGKGRQSENKCNCRLQGKGRRLVAVCSTQCMEGGGGRGR